MTTKITKADKAMLYKLGKTIWLKYYNDEPEFDLSEWLQFARQRKLDLNVAFKIWRSSGGD